MALHGLHLIAGRQTASSGSTFQAVNPSTSELLEPVFHEAGAAEVDAAMQAADAAFDALRNAPVETRAQLLEALAENIQALGDELLHRAHAETALPMARLQGERARAIGQCKLFASLIRDPETYEKFDEIVLTNTCRDVAELAYGNELVAALRDDPLYYRHWAPWDDDPGAVARLDDMAQRERAAGAPGSARALELMALQIRARADGLQRSTPRAAARRVAVGYVRVILAQ